MLGAIGLGIGSKILDTGFKFGESAFNNWLGLNSSKKLAEQQQQYTQENMALAQKYALESAAKQQEYALQSAAKQQEYAQANMNLQNQMNIDNALNNYSYQMESARRGNVNPLLALGNPSISGATALPTQVGSANVGSSGAMPGGSGSLSTAPGSEGTSFSDRLNRAQQQENQNDLTQAQIGLIEAQTAQVKDRTSSKGNTQDVENFLKEAQTDAQRSQAKSLDKQVEHYQSQINNLDADTKNKVLESYRRWAGPLADEIGLETYQALKAKAQEIGGQAGYYGVDGVSYGINKLGSLIDAVYSRGTAEKIAKIMKKDPPKQLDSVFKSTTQLSTGKEEHIYYRYE